MLKKCIKVRVPTDDGWKDCRCELQDNFVTYEPVTDYDKEIGSKCFFPAINSGYADAVTDGALLFEVSWQGDSWPE